MSRQEFKVQTNNFTGGLVTEASPLSFPENSCIDIKNVDVHPDGTVSRRSGLQVVGSGSLLPVENVIRDQYVDSFRWVAPGNASDRNFIVIKVGTTLHFYRESSNLKLTKETFVVSLGPIYSTPILSPADRMLMPIKMTTIRGLLVVTGPFLNPFYVEYVPGSNIFIGPTLIHLRMRDFKGLDDGLEVNERPTVTPISPEHSYNLVNQGWDGDKMQAVWDELGAWPSNADIWHVGRDADNNFDPEEMDKIDFGTSPAPKGRNIHFISQVPTASGLYTTIQQRPSACATFAGRIFYGTIAHPARSNEIYFSQLVVDPSKLRECMQQNDPTSEIESDILDTDGGVITIAGMGAVVHMEEAGDALLIFATNGVWEIRGEGDAFFTATGYSVRRITPVAVLCPKGVVSVEGLVFFVGEDGIYTLEENEISGLRMARNISDVSIKSWFNDNMRMQQPNITAVYDHKEKRVMWMIGDKRSLNQGFSTDKYIRKTLILNLMTQSFTVYTYPFENEPGQSNTISLVHAFAVQYNTNILPDDNIKDRPVIYYLSKYFSENVDFVDFLRMERPRHIDFSDGAFNESGSGYQEEPAYVITGYATLEDIGTRKTARQLILHTLRTETSVVNGELAHPSSCKVRIAWDFTNNENSNKWMPEFEGYRYTQLLTTETPNEEFDTGYEIITTKTKLRGTGRGFSLQLRAAPAKDMHVLGWSITGSSEAHE